MSYTFGPVPSRRLGRSLGINNIPPKYCTYACVYCQLGDPQHVTAERRPFYEVDEIAAEVREILGRSDEIDAVTVVPDGEPTLDANLLPLMQALCAIIDNAAGTDVPSASAAATPIRLAVITNGSLLPDPDVRAALMLADWVSVKIDAADAVSWRLIDRPARALSYEAIMAAATTFRESFTGIYATETMLVSGLNTDPDHIGTLARRIAELHPDIAYLSAPTRPPAEAWVEPPSEEQILSAYNIFKHAGIPVELNVEHEMGDFVAGTDIAGSILAIAAVHPIRESDLKKMLTRAGASNTVVQELVREDRLLRREYRGEVFYVTRLKPRRSAE